MKGINQLTVILLISVFTTQMQSLPIMFSLSIQNAITKMGGIILQLWEQ